MLSGKKIAVVIPVYNGAVTIGPVIKRVPPDVADDIIIVDDGSKDTSLQTVRKLERNTKNITLLVHSRNKGYGGAQKTLFDAALKTKADIIVLLHQDGQYKPEDIPRLILPLANHETLDIILAPRKNMLQGGMPKIKFFGNRVLTFFQNLLTGMKLTEYHTGFRAYRARGLRMIAYRNLTDQFHFDTEILCKAKESGLQIGEVPISTYYGKEVSQNWRLVSYGLNCIQAVLKHRFQEFTRWNLSHDRNRQNRNVQNIPRA